MTSPPRTPLTTPPALPAQPALHLPFPVGVPYQPLPFPHHPPPAAPHVEFIHDRSGTPTEKSFPSRTHACKPDPGGFYSWLFQYPSASPEHDHRLAGYNGSFTCGVCKKVCTGLVYHCHKCNKWDECPPCAGDPNYRPAQKMI